MLIQTIRDVYWPLPAEFEPEPSTYLPELSLSQSRLYRHGGNTQQTQQRFLFMVVVNVIFDMLKRGHY